MYETVVLYNIYLYMLDTVPIPTRAYNRCRFACLKRYGLSSPEVGTLAGRFEDQDGSQIFASYCTKQANYTIILLLIVLLTVMREVIA